MTQATKLFINVIAKAIKQQNPFIDTTKILIPGEDCIGMECFLFNSAEFYVPDTEKNKRPEQIQFEFCEFTNGDLIIPSDYIFKIGLFEINQFAKSSLFRMMLKFNIDQHLSDLYKLFAQLVNQDSCFGSPYVAFDETQIIPGKTEILLISKIIKDDIFRMEKKDWRLHQDIHVAYEFKFRNGITTYQRIILETFCSRNNATLNLSENGYAVINFVYR